MPQAAEVIHHIGSMMSAQQRLKSKWKEYISFIAHLDQAVKLWVKLFQFMQLGEK